jgi:hypothetical protein
MHRSICLLALLLLAAGTADAQRGRGGSGGMGGGRAGGMGGMGGGRGGAMGGREQQPNMKFPAVKKIKKYNPAALIIGKRRKLALTGAQVGQLKELRQRIFDRNAALLARYDTLQRNYRPPQMNARQGRTSEPVTDTTRRRALLEMRQLRILGDSLLERRRTDVREVMDVLIDDTQRIRAGGYLDEQDMDFADEFPAPFARRDNGNGPPPRGGRRPPAAGIRS